MDVVAQGSADVHIELKPRFRIYKLANHHQWRSLPNHESWLLHCLLSCRAGPSCHYPVELHFAEKFAIVSARC
jgi:hypothetical protein